MDHSVFGDTDIRISSSVTVFKNLLKAHLFIQLYYST